MAKDRDILLHIIEHVSDVFNAQKRFGDDPAVFSADKDYFNSVCMSLLQIGELANHLTAEFTAAHADIPWRNIVGLRNIVAHGYGSLDSDRVWLAVVNDVPVLYQNCKNILSELESKRTPSFQD